ncbi:MAG: Xaa-Pro peptidase family protein [Bryobacteraceae bacterium]|nr:Xaa-Pro peptidase family protein [Bryobacteraceae bacterium]MDW8377712.1 Xaa-Pro peptidase family protein [Bryobacterales bacterium]
MFLVQVAIALSAILISQEEFKQRRARLQAAFPEAAIVLIGSTDQDAEPRRPFLQDANFLYFTGWLEPGAVMILAPGEDVLFLPARNERKERYEGRRAAAGDVGIEGHTGFSKVAPAGSWEAELQRQITAGRKIYTSFSSRKLPLVQTAAAGAELHDLTREIARLRMIKSAREIELLQRAIDVSIEMHLAAWRRVRPGLYEYQLEGTMFAAMKEQGCERMAYQPILASGPNALILHYSANRRRLEPGDLLLVDVGAECANYASDLTRTIPVSGRFTDRQRELYEIVLGAQNAAIEAAKPGATLGPQGSLTNLAREYMNAHGKDRQGEPLGKYFTHGIGHHVGLEVHDLWNSDAPLEAGMVVTIEPGLYIPDEGIGIRIEDMVLVTPQGGRILSRKLPRGTKEIERWLNAR